MGASDLESRGQVEQPEGSIPSPSAKPISPVLARLIEEVRREQINGPHLYDRIYTRHNRS